MYSETGMDAKGMRRAVEASETRTQEILEKADGLSRRVLALERAIDKHLLRAAPIAAAFRLVKTEVEPHEYDGFLDSLAALQEVRGPRLVPTGSVLTPQALIGLPVIEGGAASPESPTKEPPK